jgi:hypothetical protein
MKIRRLSEIDLARFVSLPAGPQLDQALRNYNTGGGSWSYGPVRSSTADILGARTPLHGALPPVPWEKLKRQIARACTKGEAQTKSNVQVGKVLFDEARKAGWLAAKYEMGNMPVGIGETVRYWSDVLLNDEEGMFVPFFDHRRENGVSSPAIRQVVFSMQHIWVRDRYPDLSDARLAIVRFPISDATRGVRIEFASDGELLSYDELNARVRVVYESWARVSEERVREPRRSGTDGNPFDF